MHEFRGTPTRATLNVELASGESYTINFKEVHKMNTDNGFADINSWNGFREYVSTGITTLTIEGRAELDILTSTKEKKHMEKPRKPSVKTCAASVHKATVKQVQLLKKIADAEKLFNELRLANEENDVALKAAKEQLVASASA